MKNPNDANPPAGESQQSEISDADKLKLAELAILTTLIRIRDEPKVQFYCGVGTNVFEQLCVAQAALTGDPLDRVMEAVIPGSAAIRHSTVAEMLRRAA